MNIFKRTKPELPNPIQLKCMICNDKVITAPTMKLALNRLDFHQTRNKSCMKLQ